MQNMPEIDRLCVQIPPTATAEEEIERLSKPSYHAQWNFSLYDDASLIVC